MHILAFIGDRILIDPLRHIAHASVIGGNGQIGIAEMIQKIAQIKRAVADIGVRLKQILYLIAVFFVQFPGNPFSRIRQDLH